MPPMGGTPISPWPQEMFAADASADPATELCELLVAGGYFRARITGLSAFDKVAGGLAWDSGGSFVPTR